MKLSESKFYIEQTIREQIGSLKKNRKYCNKRVDEKHSEIDKSIEKWGDIDVGLLISAGVDLPFLDRDCAHLAIADFHRNYPSDEDKIAMIDALPPARVE